MAYEGRFAGALAVLAVGAAYAVAGGLELVFFPTLDFNVFLGLGYPWGLTLALVVFVGVPALTVLVAAVVLPGSSNYVAGMVGAGIFAALGVFFFFLGFEWLLVLGGLTILTVATALFAQAFLR